MIFTLSFALATTAFGQALPTARDCDFAGGWWSGRLTVKALRRSVYFAETFEQDMPMALLDPVHLCQTQLYEGTVVDALSSQVEWFQSALGRQDAAICRPKAFSAYGLLVRVGRTLVKRSDWTDGSMWTAKLDLSKTRYAVGKTCAR